MDARMTWDDMVKQYPNKWVVVRDAQKDGPDIESGVLVDVKTDDEIGSFRANNSRKGYTFRRTTEDFFNGVTGSDIIVSVN